MDSLVIAAVAIIRKSMDYSPAHMASKGHANRLGSELHFIISAFESGRSDDDRSVARWRYQSVSHVADLVKFVPTAEPTSPRESFRLDEPEVGTRFPFRCCVSKLTCANIETRYTWKYYLFRQCEMFRYSFV